MGISPSRMCLVVDVLPAFYTSIMIDTKLRNIAVIVGAVLVLTVGSVFTFPDSGFSSTVFKFQTLITGAMAGISALVGASYVYRAAKLPIDAKNKSEIIRTIALKKAGAAVLLTSINNVFTSVITEIDKEQYDRTGRLVVPEGAPGLQAIVTQDAETIALLAQFLAEANQVDAQTVNGAWNGLGKGLAKVRAKGLMDELYEPLREKLASEAGIPMLAIGPEED